MLTRLVNRLRWRWYWRCRKDNPWTYQRGLPVGYKQGLKLAYPEREVAFRREELARLRGMAKWRDLRALHLGIARGIRAGAREAQRRRERGSARKRLGTWWRRVWREATRPDPEQ